jgi:formylglycine-generating enzyme required for sulfatase activity
MSSRPLSDAGKQFARSQEDEFSMRIAEASTSSASKRQSQYANTRRMPGGTFRMGSGNHYPEEAPVHRVMVDGFWMKPHARPDVIRGPV